MKNSPQTRVFAWSLVALFWALVAVTQAASAAGQASGKGPLLDKNQFSIGAGLALNSVGRGVDDELGIQFFGAYKLSAVKLMDGVDSSIEVGYMDYGFDGRDADGLWGTYVVNGAMTGQLNWLARLGYDIGDDNGVMFGAGMGVNLDKRVGLRVEYVIRDEIDSLQLNFLYRM